MSDPMQGIPIPVYASGEHLRQLDSLISRLEIATARAEFAAETLSTLYGDVSPPRHVDEHDHPISDDNSHMSSTETENGSTFDFIAENKNQLIASCIVGCVALLIVYLMFFFDRAS